MEFVDVDPIRLVRVRV